MTDDGQGADEASEREGERVGAPVDEREHAADDVLADVPGDAAPEPLPEPDELQESEPDSAGTQVVPEPPPLPVASAAGLRADFGAHLEANYQRLVAQLYAITLDPGEAHDLVQDAYSRAWRSWATIGRSPDPSAWVRRVAVRSSARSWRRTLARIGIARTRPVPDGVDERTAALLGALGRLSPAERRAVVQFHMAGSSLEEIAAVEQVGVGIVQARLARARRVVTEGMADVLSAVLGAAAGAEHDRDYGTDYSPDYGADHGAAEYGADYGTGGYSAWYDTGGYAAGGELAGGYGDGYGYGPGTGDNEGERR